MAEVQIKVSYGALADPLEDQLNKQGFTLGEKKEFLGKLHHSLIMCMFHLLTDSQYQSCQKKLHKRVIDAIKPLNIEG